MNLLSKAKLGAKWNAISMLGSAALSILQISILARYLQPLDFGIFALLIVILSILSIFITVSISDVIIVKDNVTYEQLSTL
ncbi:oligosaccharide flippase family protein, partial [Gammaproteobacteria bacterium]|nr:oligosaccharide flippase family protein [Gammaproteobacteria bacterium]